MSDKSSSDEGDVGGDIVIGEDQMNSFFLMDSDEEEKNYGATTKASMVLTNTKLKQSGGDQEQVST